MRTMLCLLLLAGLEAPAFAQDVTYRKHIRPLWEAKCAVCHERAT